MKKRTAIVGSREFTDYEYLKGCVLSVIHPSDIASVVSGGARGADKLAKRFAREFGLTMVEFFPDWTLGKTAGFLRNTKIVEHADLVIAFPARVSTGTWDTMYKAGLRKIPVHEFKVLQ